MYETWTVHEHHDLRRWSARYRAYSRCFFAPSSAWTMNQLSLLLLVDSDRKGLEALTYGFEREGCAVAGTIDPAMAPELARTTTPQLAVISLHEPDPQELNLISGLREQPGTRDLPVVTLGPASPRRAARSRLRGQVPAARSPVSPADLLKEAGRSRRYFPRAARDPGPPGRLSGELEGGPARGDKKVPAEATRVVRLFDGQRALAEVIE